MSSFVFGGRKRKIFRKFFVFTQKALSLRPKLQLKKNIMKKNLIYLFMFMAMPLAFVACGDDNNGITNNVNATGEYDGNIEILVNGENFFEAINPALSSSPVTFTLNQQENATSLSINDSILIIGALTLEVNDVPSTADSEKLTINGQDMDLEKNIIGMDVVINSLTGTVTKAGAANLSIEAAAPLLQQTVNIEISAQKK